MSQIPSTLFYFTESYPFGLGEAWKTNELKVLKDHFAMIYVVPVWYANNHNPVQVPGSNIKVLEPALESIQTRGSWKDLFLLMNPSAIRDLAAGKAIANRHNIRKCLDFIKTANRLKRSSSFRFVLENSNENTVWYFFWARGWADLLPFITRPQIKKIAVKLHGYDLYLNRNKGYIPFRSDMLKMADLLLPISETGRNYLLNQYRLSTEKVEVSRLGTISAGLSKPGDGKTLNLISCSGMVPVKRLDRIVTGLQEISDFPVRWVHIGNGPLEEEIRNGAATLPANIRVHFAGKMTAREVVDYYVEHEADLFINTSESEGVPVSIMEAFSAGIPAVATAVGGTGEIVDDTVGKLLSADPAPKEIADALRSWHRLPPEERSGLRQRAFKRYQEKCDAEKWANHLQQLLQ